MNLEIVRKVLLWCIVINYGILFVWWLFFLFTHEWMYGWHSRWFHLSVEQFDALHYVGMSLGVSLRIASRIVFLHPLGEKCFESLQHLTQRAIWGYVCSKPVAPCGIAFQLLS